MRSDRSESVVSSASLVGLLLGSTCGGKPCSTFHDVMDGGLKKNKSNIKNLQTCDISSALSSPLSKMMSLLESSDGLQRKRIKKGFLQMVTRARSGS